jgi:SAM-dependent methyltransferase
MSRLRRVDRATILYPRKNSPKLLDCLEIRNGSEGVCDRQYSAESLLFCGLVSNRCLASKLDYDESYENSLDFSPSFQAYAQNLAERLRKKYNLRYRRIMEIGSGRGEFLKLLSADGENDCIGYDPAFDGAGTDWPGVRFVQDYYNERHASESVDFVTCRHLLEHMEEPLRFLTDLRQTLAAQGEVAVYFEVPNAFLVFAGQTMVGRHLPTCSVLHL